MTKEKNIKIDIIKKYDLDIKGSKYHINMLFNNLIKNAILYNKINGKINIIINSQNIIIEDT
jgi:signal transduction histidine kinase